jgi:anthranilate phosphoribosyltransferase
MELNEFGKRLDAIMDMKDQSFDDVYAIMDHLFAHPSVVQTAAVLVAFKMKGETLPEIRATADVIRKYYLDYEAYSQLMSEIGLDSSIIDKGCQLLQQLGTTDKQLYK